MKKIISFVLCAVMVCTSAALFAGCGSGSGSGSSENKGEVNVYNWGDYVANGMDGLKDVVAEFEKETGIKVNYTTYDTNEELYNMLKNSNAEYDVIVPSEYMVTKLKSEDMLMEINFDNIPNYKYINERFKKLPCDPEGKYTVCYDWGVTAMIYDKTKVDKKPTSWEALWDPKLKGQILMINNSRDAMGIAMQLCGINPSNFTKEDVDKAAAKLREQKPLVKKYVMDQVFTEMEGSQAAIAPYYAGDISVIMDNNENLDYAFPESGSNLFYDSFCIPKTCKNKENAEAFINFMNKPEIAAENCKYLLYGTPNDGALEYLDDDIKNSELTFPSDEYVNKCYTFSDVDPEVYAYMQEQFLKIQSTN